MKAEPCVCGDIRPRFDSDAEITAAVQFHQRSPMHVAWADRQANAVPHTHPMRRGTAPDEEVTRVRCTVSVPTRRGQRPCDHPAVVVYREHGEDWPKCQHHDSRVVRFYAERYSVPRRLVTA